MGVDKPRRDQRAGVVDDTGVGISVAKGSRADFGNCPIFEQNRFVDSCGLRPVGEGIARVTQDLAKNKRFCHDTSVPWAEGKD